jgi:hypothetical protein
MFRLPSRRNKPIQKMNKEPVSLKPDCKIRAALLFTGTIRVRPCRVRIAKLATAEMLTAIPAAITRVSRTPMASIPIESEKSRINTAPGQGTIPTARATEKIFLFSRFILLPFLLIGDPVFRLLYMLVTTR